MDDLPKDNESDREKVAGEVSEDRRAMIDSAQRFLLNPKVQQSPMAQKRKFLQSKGLTDVEIDAACQRAGIPLTDPPSLLAIHPHDSSYQVFHSHRSSWVRSFRDVMEVAAFLGATLYGMYHFWKRYVSKWLFGTYHKTNEEIQKETSEALLTSVKSLIQSVETLQVFIDQQLGSLHATLQEKSNKDLRHDFISEEVRSELKSIKGIMLSTSRFPVSPSVKPATIPSWQLEIKNEMTESSSLPSESEERAVSKEQNITIQS